MPHPFSGRSRERVPRARGRGRGNLTRLPWEPPKPPEPDPIPTDLGEVVETVRREDLKPTTSQPTVIRNARSVASFNWIGGKEVPTIAIPGAPPKWSPPGISPQLSEDSGTYYRDLNAAFLPTHPLHATALAILNDPTFSTSSVDLMACASTLRSLFLFTIDERKSFRISVEAIGDTVFFIRREGSPRDVIPGIRGYGHTMPEAYTEWHSDVKGSISNQRVLAYRFAGMECLIRYEPDGYLAEKLPGEGTLASSSPPCADACFTSSSFELDLGAAMSSMGVPQTLPPEGNDGELAVRHAGMTVPQSAIYELKTRSEKRKDEDFFPEFAPRFWFTQAPYFVLGFHTRGRFNDVRVDDVRARVATWEAENQDVIKKFARLVEWIVERVRAEPDGMLELWRHQVGNLEVRMPGGGFYGALPSDLEDQWTDRERGGVSLDVSNDEDDGVVIS